MSTNSNIGIVNKDGSVESIYCHWDGYIEHNGLILMLYYQDEQKIRDLINLGDISSLHRNVNIPEGISHNFESINDGICVAYHRDRGEDKHIALNDNVSDFLKKRWQEYNYLYDVSEKKWKVTFGESKQLEDLLDIALNLILCSNSADAIDEEDIAYMPNSFITAFTGEDCTKKSFEYKKDIIKDTLMQMPEEDMRKVFSDYFEGKIK